MTYLILALATWRISNLLVNEDGPWSMFARVRAWAGVRYNMVTLERESGGAFTCIWCMSIWIGLCWALAWRVWPDMALWVATPFALSAGAILVDRWVNA